MHRRMLLMAGALAGCMLIQGASAAEVATNQSLAAKSLT
jgi:hypothetical protein